LDCFGPGARFHHVGIAVSSIRAILPACQPTHDPIQKVNVALVLLNGLRLEQIESVGEDSPISLALKKGIKYIHVCFEVDDVKVSLRCSRKWGFHVIRQPAPATAFHERQIAFVFSRSFGLIELLESAKRVGV
jgi:methylmalonyl-CoA/ethylmalonyl-CoA epimerase